MFKTGFDATNLTGKCYYCKYYEPLVKTLWGYKEVLQCRGHCMHGKVTKCRYRQRTDTCKKFERVD